ncbi:MAG: hypothetical protein N2690_12355, partial [Rhodocyclaceae bacterium]|nr:hypothetical protein [Rhodocyclaceae bacterium]
MSTNLCADLLLLRLADPAQIRSVSSQAQDPRLSPVAQRARAYPANRGSLEEVLAFQPDIAFVYQGWRPYSWNERLQRQGIAIIGLPYPRSWDEALAAARLMAQALGRAAES